MLRVLSFLRAVSSAAEDAARVAFVDLVALLVAGVSSVEASM
jgi:hypothetical protein